MICYDSTRLRDAVFWFDRKEPPLPALKGVTSTYVAVVGGGMMGLVCAKTLLPRGQRVCEGRTTAQSDCLLEGFWQLRIRRR